MVSAFIYMQARGAHSADKTVSIGTTDLTFIGLLYRGQLPSSEELLSEKLQPVFARPIPITSFFVT